ncbi:sulfatase-like hydrolase/transferase [Panacibacter ginsenosidivorans]|uniref:Sulfatase-like hydrolase/transferase n=1 Tax=Panacibacter ginsenosidivorans TaxID=1813871 RepID=A0A5B8VEW5_9BACT|nr:sulfatase-like hydrolase/transferase [Panacibacter ginsenosidivorans]QEC69859.1 sulfatase-like hydrolase/transferase [Panacibacter ginsenosidivorans]
MKYPKLIHALSANSFLFLFLLFITASSCHKADELKPLQSIASDGEDASGAVTKPNIIVILGDDIGYFVPTADGGQTYSTPNIDKMAAKGMRFTQCYSSPLCAPSRFAIMTGKYNFRNYVDWGVMNPNEKTFGTLLRDAGYATYVAGKWELDGADSSIRSLGFPRYSVYNPSKTDPQGSRYKDPTIYTAGNYLPAALTQGKYGDDIFTDSVLNFVKQNRRKNFFVYFPITLCHYPYSPTPDDPEFASWNAKTSTPDTAFFPSMAKYMDKKVGQIMDSLAAWNLSKKTIVMFIGDNGTPHYIYYYVNGVRYEGQKGESTTAGTHVPLIVAWPGKIAPRQVNPNLVDFTDFLPTLADAAGITIPSTYGTIDGHSFYNQLVGLPTTPRDWIFCHYAPGTEGGNAYKRWTQDTTYKLYDSTGAFYNIITDPDEKSPIKPANRTAYQKQLVTKFQSIMDGLH